VTTPATASQTVGPFFKIGLEYRCTTALCGAEVAGEHVTIQGVMYDGAGIPVPDAQLELWQADAEGRFAGLDTGTGVADPGFPGFARIALDDTGRYVVRTVKPGIVVSPDGSSQAPHIVVMIFMRGILRHLHTRVYFPGESANDTDPTLQAVPLDRQHTLIAQALEGKPGEYLWNIHLQGDNETAFFAY
jgi:protocatechuate 3,4-dioxygenase, alpha subunit